MVGVRVHELLCIGCNMDDYENSFANFMTVHIVQMCFTFHIMMLS